MLAASVEYYVEHCVQCTLGILYKGIAYKVFFGPVLKVLADLRVFSTEASCPGLRVFSGAILYHGLE